MMAPLEIGDRRELFVDDYMIAPLSGGARRRLHHPVAGQVVMKRDQPWEGNLCSGDCLFHDGHKFRLYYRGMQVETRKDHLGIPHTPFICYAESADGIHWTKPDLGLLEFNGSKQNNIVLTPEMYGGGDGEGASVASIFRDENPAAEANAQYKGLALTHEPGNFGLLPLQSADGIRFAKMSDKAVIRQGQFDSQNLVFWDKTRGEYRAYYRDSRLHEQDSYRWIRTATSPDFINWTEHPLIEFPGDLAAYVEEYYTNQIQPYFRAPHLFLGFPMRYVERDSLESFKTLPDLENRRQRATASLRFGTALTDTLLISSRDGQNFQRWAEAFIAPGPQRPDSWSYGSSLVAWQMLETPSDIKGAANEITFLVNEGAWTGTSCQLRRYTLRLDGFVSVKAPASGGEVVTKPILFNGNQLAINFATSAGGEVRVELQDAAGQPLPGFTLEDSQSIFGDTTDRVVEWKNGADVSALAGQPVQMRFALRDADLYAFQFVS